MNMTCLNDIQIQALADGEADAAAQDHAADCARCGERLRERRLLLGAIERSIDVPVPIPISTARRVEEGLRGGATRLRDSRDFRLSSHSRSFRLQADGKWLYGGLGVAA